MPLRQNERLENNIIALQGSASLDRLAFLSMLYLGLPIALFFIGWVKTPCAMPLLFALIFSFFMLWRSCKMGADSFHIKPVYLVFLGIAIAWTSLGGAGHFFYANEFDWSVRDAVLHDLTVASWPPGYKIGATGLWILRYPIGYFLPAAVAGKIFGLSSADLFLWGWTAIGIWIFFCLLPIDTRSLKKIAIAITIVVFFSGMDIVGWWALRHTNPPLLEHMEWWAGLFQYSSNTTLLFWTPNHALPGWIAAALFWRHWKTDKFIAVSPLLLSFLPLWSPFPFLGLLPFYLLLLIRVVHEKKWGEINWPILAVSVLNIAVASIFLSTDIGNIPEGSTLNQVNFMAFILIYALFILLEFGILARSIWNLIPGRILSVASIVLLFLPFFRFGPGNDLVMRASIPALMFLCITSIIALQNLIRTKGKAFIELSIILLLGAITPIHEFSRAIMLPTWKPSPTRTVAGYGGDLPPHYAARVKHDWKSYVFKNPSGILTASASNNTQDLPKDKKH